MRKNIILATLSVFFYCCGQQSNKSTSLNNEQNSKNKIKDNVNNAYCDSLKGSIGTVTLNDKTYEYGIPINILNSDNTVFETISKNEEKQIIAFKCIAKDEDQYSILYKDEIKYLSAQDLNLKFNTWQEHLSNNIFSIDFDFKTNPLRDGKNGNSISVVKNNNHRISIIAVDGNWLEIKYEDFENEKSIKGWIKWRNENCLLVKMFYFA